MDGNFIVTTYVVLDKTMAALGHRDDVRAQASDAEVLMVSVISARYFRGHVARALQMMRLGRYLSGERSASRFRCRPHALCGWLALALESLGALFARGAVFLIDSMPVPVYRRARARRCRTVSSRDFCACCDGVGCLATIASSRSDALRCNCGADTVARGVCASVGALRFAVARPSSRIDSGIDDRVLRAATRPAPAELVRVSGVLAVVAAGLYVSRRSARIFSADARLRANTVSIAPPPAALAAHRALPTGDSPP